MRLVRTRAILGNGDGVPTVVRTEVRADALAQESREAEHLAIALGA
jgi:hypothetical protein